MRTAHRRVVLGLHRSRYERRLLTGALDLGIDAIDTSFNYRGFTAHAALADIGDDLLPRFMVSTKVGYFPGPDGAEHSLDPARLRAALEQTNRDLGRPPDLVFLHNPEHSVRDASERSRNALARACAALADATAQGLCGTWGVASWDPRPLVGIADRTAPPPSVLMVRVGLLVGAENLAAAESLADRWEVGPDRRWGMSPFGGSTRAPIWDAVDPRLFLQDRTAGLSPIQAAFLAAYRLPPVSAIAVGSDRPAHLRELLDALEYEVDEQTILAYRGLLRDRARPQPA